MHTIGQKRIWKFFILLVVVTLLLTACANKSRHSADTMLESGLVTEPEKGYFRVLVVGTDRSSGLADTVMLVSLNRDSGEAWVLQIPRDTYAAYTERDYRKLNGAANALGGMAEMRSFLSEALGLPIDRYMAISLDVFAQAVDALGGVEIVLSEPMEYEDPTQGLSIHLPAGRQRLDGKTAEQFVRYRSGYTRGDLDRIDAQKVFLAALFRTVCDTRSPVKLIQLATTLLGKVETDVTMGDVLLLLPEILRLKADQISFVTAPGSDAVATVSGASYYVLSAKGMATLLRAHFGAKDAEFDPRRVFLHDHYTHFQAIYEADLPYRAFTASKIE